MDHPRVLHKPTKGRAEVFSLETEDGANVVTSGEIWGVDELIFTLLKCKYIQMAPECMCVCVSVPHTHTFVTVITADHHLPEGHQLNSCVCYIVTLDRPTSFVRSNNSAIFKFICLIPSFCVVSVCAAWITTASVSGHVYSKCSVWFFFIIILEYSWFKQAGDGFCCSQVIHICGDKITAISLLSTGTSCVWPF